MCTIFPLVLQPARDALYHMLGLYFPMFKSVKTVPFWLHAIICATMSFVSLVLGLFIDKTNVWFSLVGSFCTAFLGFIFPALFYMYSGNWSLKTVGWFNYISTYLLLIGGIISLVFGCAAVVYLEIFPDATE
ncbi:amino acid transporter [Strigomonas culicis]|nr:amino acid transporter [Strigomonas culicis]|eukprot:EPY33913.1 amino acid transporter [Strigomonas culicis]